MSLPSVNFDCTKLQKLQNSASRILTFSSDDANVDDLLKIIGWKKLDVQRKIETASMVYIYLNGCARLTIWYFI